MTVSRKRRKKARRKQQGLASTKTERAKQERLLRERSERLKNRPKQPKWKDPNIVVRDGPKIGRNNSCPCGSGKKYKKCCLGGKNAEPTSEESGEAS